MHRTCILLLLASITFGHGKEPVTDKVPAPDPIPAAAPVDLEATAKLIQKMNEIIIPTVHFENTTLDQALEFLRKKSRELDKSSDPSGDKGVNIILHQPALPDAPRLTLDLKNVPLSEALRYVTELTHMVYRVEAPGVLLTDMHAYQRERHTRTFRVPSDFLSVGDSAPADPFATPATEPNPSGGLIHRKSAQQILEAAGITFPENSSASFNPLTGLLRVTNTLPNLDIVEAYCESSIQCLSKIFAFNLTIVEGPGDLIHQINAEASKSADASKQLTTLIDLAQKPGTSVRVAGNAFLETKPCSAATTEFLSEPRLSNDVSTDLASRPSEASDQQLSGLRLKLEPNVFPDGQTIDLGFDLALSPPSSHGKDGQNLNAQHPDSTVPKPTSETPKVHLTSNLLIRGDSTKLAGIARPPDLRQKTDDTLWAAFITSAIRYPGNQPHHLARGVPSPSEPPKGLSSITFQIPAGLFESIMEPSPKPLRDWLIDQGVTFPQGASIDLQNNLLLMTNTEENIEIISTLIAAAVQKASKTIAVTLHTVRLPSSFLPKLSQATLASTDQSAEWKEVEAAAARGEAVFLESCFFETRSGTRSTHGSARECYFLDQTIPQDKSPHGISLNHQTFGSSLEIEPTLNAEGRIMAVDYYHNLHVAAGSPDEASPNDHTTDRDLPLSGTSLRTLKTHSHTTMEEGEIRLISLHQDIARNHPDHLWATFLQCSTIPHFPKPPHVLAVTASATADPNSLETRTYHPPLEILSELRQSLSPLLAPAMGENPFGTSPTSQELPHSPNLPAMGKDPFGAFPTPQKSPHRPNSPQEVLQKLELTFPQGSLTHFDSATSTLIIHNTPANHALMAAAIEKSLLASPGTVAITTHVLQGSGLLLRRLAAQASRKSDHRAELDELLAAVKTGTVLHLDTARLETKPGTRATVNQGSAHKAICELSLDEKAQSILKQETRHIGLNVELEPTTSKDNPFVNLVLSAEYHTAPPFEHQEHIIDTQRRRVEFPLTDYFTSKVTTGITIPDGTARLLSLYKPTGKPEFEKEDILQAIFITCDILRAGE